MASLLLCGLCLCLLLPTTTQFRGQTVRLGMYENSFDDQYIGCLDKMESNAPELLKKERQNDSYFNEAWQYASQTWLTKKQEIKSLPSGFRDNNGIALLVYSGNQVYSRFNRAVREYGANPRSFAFHALHFYLKRALSLLQPKCDRKLWRTYRGVNGIVFEPPSGTRGPIRFSQFTSSSTDFNVAQRFGTTSFFKITTCFGADIEKFSYYPGEKEVLIPVDEVFQITNYMKQGNQFVLQSTYKRCSFYNCAYLGGHKRQNCTYSSA